MATIPSQTRLIDTIFTTTWYEMQKKAIDNILDSNVLSAELRMRGSYKTQVGGKKIERTIRYGEKVATSVKKGDTLATGEDEIETAAFFDWKYITVHIQRSLQDDQQNTGPAKIKSLVQVKIEAARDALETKFENALFAAVTLDGSAAEDKELRLTRDPLSIVNMLPASTYYNQAVGTYTYGGIDTGTGNVWWQGKYNASATNPALMNIKDEMKVLYNDCSKAGQDRPDLIITDQTLHEAFEDVCASEIQRTTDVGSTVAKLGYDVLKYKGADVVWTPNTNIASGVMYFLNTRWIDVVYDPNLWFTMMPWQPLPNQFERIARIVCSFPGLICSQLRRQGYLGAYTS